MDSQTDDAPTWEEIEERARQAEAHPADLPLNGGTLLAALPDVMYGRGWYVAVELPGTTAGTRALVAMSGHRYVSAWVASLSAPHWAHGSYRATLDEVLTDTYSRAGARLMPDAERVNAWPRPEGETM